MAKLYYFDLMARGLQSALCMELSGLAWQPSGFTRDQWDELKPTTPFGQMPVLEIDGMMIGQSAAILNYIGHRANMLGSTNAEYAICQMLLVCHAPYWPHALTVSAAVQMEGDAIYTQLDKYCPTWNTPLQDPSAPRSHLKGTHAECASLWADTLPAHLSKLEALLKGRAAFTESGTTVGEVQIWGLMHQMVLVNPDILAPTPGLAGFYRKLLAHGGVQKVLAGQSHFGPMKQYFVKDVTTSRL